MSTLESMAELSSLLETWERESQRGNVINSLTKICELVEKETEAYYKMDPDPFDDRHPGRADPSCSLGFLLKAVFKNEEFMNKLVNVYLLSSRDDTELATVACRLLLSFLPGLESSVVFNENETLVRYLLRWAETGPEPLRSYATGLLPAAMEVYDIAANFREDNSRLVPLMLNRLHDLKNGKEEDMRRLLERPFASVCDKSLEKASDAGTENFAIPSPPKKIGDSSQLGPKRTSFGVFNEVSNSSWAEMEPYLIGMYCLNPLTMEMKSRLIVQYLTVMGEFQELLGFMFEHNAMELIFYYTDLKKNCDVRLAFESLKFLASLLCHKKFSIEFIQVGGVQRLLQIHRPSIAATGVSMCLYYLGYFEDAMERVCLLSEQVLSDLVSFVLWLLECSHESGRCHATMFFSASFHFPVIAKLFDAKDGLRNLINVISTLDIISLDGPNPMISDDEVFTSRQATRHVCLALKKYFESRLATTAKELQRNHAQREGHHHVASINPAYKAAKYTAEVISDYMDLLLECFPARTSWTALDHFLELDGVTLMLRLIALAAEWTNFAGKAETIKSALDVLAVCSIVPKVQLQLCECTLLPDENSTPSISILLGMAEGEILVDADVMRSAIQIINNCVCGPVSQLPSNMAKFMTPTSSKKRLTGRGPEDVIRKMWHNVRSNNGIMVILKLLMVKVPITEADSIRAHACRALVGLSRDDKVRQIIGKLSLFNSSQLQMLMKEPVLQDKRLEHVKFCRYATELIERVSGKPNHPSVDATLERIKRADVVAQTKIIYQEKELLQLMYEHLIQNGYMDSATALVKEASLQPRNFIQHPTTPKIYSGTPKFSRQFASPGSSGYLSTPQPSTSQSKATTPGSIKINIINSKIQSSPSPSHTHIKRPARLLREKNELVSSSLPSPLVKRNTLPDSTVSLDKIVTEYLRKQHALCSNPVVTCPPFSLLQPHRCPTPKHKTSAPVNITPRIFRKWISPRYGGLEGAKYDRKYIYSRFRPVMTYRDSEEDGCFSCVAFSADEQQLILGTYTGELKLYNIQSAEEQHMSVCHNSPISHCQPSRDGNLVLTSAASWGSPLSALWSMPTIDLKLSFDDEDYIEFSKVTQDKIIATRGEIAKIYDVQTGQVILKLDDPNKANNYSRNRATFNYTDDLILSDGILWDVRNGKTIHKFDKFNTQNSGVFHPMGLEIIINTEVWDLRSFNLLHTVPALDQNHLCFNHSADVMYGVITQPEEDVDDDEFDKCPMGTSFRTFDATDYTSIATIDIKKKILDICTDRSDCYLAVIENHKNQDALSDEIVCKLYEVGRLRDEEDDQLEDEEDEIEDMEDDDDDDDDDSGDGDGDNEDDGNDDDDVGSELTLSMSDDENDVDIDDDNTLYSFI